REPHRSPLATGRTEMYATPTDCRVSLLPGAHGCLRRDRCDPRRGLQRLGSLSRDSGTPQDFPDVSVDARRSVSGPLAFRLSGGPPAAVPVPGSFAMPISFHALR